MQGSAHLATLNVCIAAKRGGSGKYTPCNLTFYFGAAMGGCMVLSLLESELYMNVRVMCEGDVRVMCEGDVRVM